MRGTCIQCIVHLSFLLDPFSQSSLSPPFSFFPPFLLDPFFSPPFLLDPFSSLHSIFPSLNPPFLLPSLLPFSSIPFSSIPSPPFTRSSLLSILPFSSFYLPALLISSFCIISLLYYYSFYIPYTEADSPCGVPIACANGEVDVRVKIKQSDAIPGPKLDVQVLLDSIHMLLYPQQLHSLIELLNGITKKCKLIFVI